MEKKLMLEKLLKIAQKSKELSKEEQKKLDYPGDIDIDLVIKYLSEEIENKN